MKKFFKVVGVIFGALIGIYIILDITFSIQLHNKINELKKQGRPTTIAEIIPLPVPDEENAAILYNKAFELMKWSNEENVINKMYKIIDELKSFSNISQWTDKQKEEIPKLINSKEIQDIYGFIEEGSNKPKCRFNLEYEKGAEMELPHLSKMRTTVRLLCLKSLLEAESGNIEQAFDTLLIGLKISNHLKDEPIPVSQLVRIACDNTIIECVEGIADSKSITPEQVSLVMNELSAHEGKEPFIKCIDGERVLIGDWVGRLIRGEVSWKELAGMITIQATLGDPKDWKYPLNVRLLCYVFTSPLYRPMLKKDYICYLTLLSKLEDDLKVSYYKVADQVEKETIEKQIPKYCLATKWLVPGIYRMQENIARHQANIEVCRTGLALKIHKVGTGAYPETLFFLSELSVDPFSGKNLIYKKSADGFILYSLGPNMKDDSGTPKAKEYKDPAYENYDIIWKCEK